MDPNRHILQVYVGLLSPQYEALSIEVSKQTSCYEIVTCIVERLGLTEPNNYELAEVIGNARGQECKERRLGSHETPIGLQMLWPQSSIAESPEDFEQHEYRFCLREKISSDSLWAEPSQLDSQLIKDYFYKFLYQPKDKEYPDLCQLTNLNEQALLENLKARFNKGHIYTYVGSILISVNPFKYYPIYNPKYVKLYQNHRLEERPPHIFAIADAAYQSMLKQRKNQCIVISGESGSGKTEATLFLLHHLTMLSQKGSHGSGVEQTILSSGPVLEAFGNAKTAHNNNSSRFGKFIQVSYKENGLVQGACVQKYLLEKSRICSQAFNERSYHVFYYLLAGGSNQERQALYLMKPSDYRYLNKSDCYTIEGCDEQYEFVRLKQSMEMVGFTQDKQHRLFAVLSAVLLLGNIEFSPKKSNYHHDESVVVRNWELACKIATLLGVSEDTLVNSLTSKKAKVQGEILVINYRFNEALAARDALAKCLYGALFDWIVLQVNYSLISLKEPAAEINGNSIGVLDIFGFEDFGHQNRFEQFCINYANEHLQHYFNQHVFEYEQEEYRREGISWTNIGFQDNIKCLALIEGKPAGLLCILDDQCNFPGATNETFLEKINSVHKDNHYYEIPQKRESAFIIKHYAGKVKYQIQDIREKNLDLMRPELISVLKNSQFSVVRELAGADPVAVFRWAILRAFFRAVSAFQVGRGSSKRKASTESLRKNVKHKVSVDNTRILAAIENTQNRLRKTRHNRSRSRAHGSRNQKNLKSVKALALRTQSYGSMGNRQPGSRKSPHTVTGQFQLSLQTLMEALNQANPFFIRCIKSNASKEPNMFDNELVQRQLRYTGMLETVRIRQAGFNVRMTYDEFTQLYRILLPNGLESSQHDVKEFLCIMNLEADEYQMGRNKLFMRESQKQKLDSLLHQTILSRIIVIQRWYRARHQRVSFIRLRAAVVRIQSQVRSWLAQQYLNHMRMQHRAATCIQRIWRGYRVRRWYQTIRSSVVRLQARVRGNQSRERFMTMLDDWRNTKKRLPEETQSLASITTQFTEINENPEVQQLPPPRRRSSSHQKKLSSLSRLMSDPQTQSDGIKRRSSAETTTSVEHPEISRRMSETAIMEPRKHRHALLRRSEELLPSNGPSPLLSLKGDASEPDGSRASVKTKSFRHRQYYKIPSDSDKKLDESSNLATLPITEEGGRSSGQQFPKIKKHLKSFIVKKDGGSISESDDNSYESSGPQTPSSIGDFSSSFPTLNYHDSRLSRETSPSSSKVLLRNEESSKINPKISQSLPSDKDFLSLVPVKDDLKKLLSNTHHNLKQSQLRKGELCSSCDKPFTKFFVNQGYKCTTCRKLFHTGCVKSSMGVGCLYAHGEQLETTSSPNLKKQRRIEEKNWNVTRTSQFIDRSDDVIKDVNELKALEDFIARKIHKLKATSEDKTDQGGGILGIDTLEMRERKDSQVDVLFCHSLHAFKRFLVSVNSGSCLNDKPENLVILKYKDLIKNFEKEMNTVCQESCADATFPVTMGVNAFRGFLDEFIRDKTKNPETKITQKKKRRPRRKKKNKKEEIHFGSHIFIHILVNIYTQCEVCNSFLWLSTKALSCQKCKVTCHQKCLNRAEPSCNQGLTTKAIVIGLDSSRKSSMGSNKNSRVSAVSLPLTGKVFGVPLENLLTAEEKIPRVVERLMICIELHGLYTVGLYRKSGATSKVKEIKKLIDEDPDNVTFDDVQIHVVTSIFKSYLRELPEPLLTFDSYAPILHASALEDSEDVFTTTLNVIQQLPKANYDLLERLIFHLTLVAQREEYNRMNCNALAIVFTPCILRSPKSVPVQDSLNDISKQTQAVELFLSRHLIKTCDVHRDIERIEDEAMTAEAKLESIKASKAARAQLSEGPCAAMPRLDPRDALAAYKLEEHLQTLEETKSRLTYGLTELVRTSSEEDFLSTDMSRAGSMEDVSSNSTFRSVPSTPSLAYEDVSSELQRRRRERRPRHLSGDDKSDSSLRHDDAVMV